MFLSPAEFGSRVLRLGDFEVRLSGTFIKFGFSLLYFRCYSRLRLGDGQDVFVSYHFVKGGAW